MTRTERLEPTRATSGHSQDTLVRTSPCLLQCAEQDIMNGNAQILLIGIWENSSISVCHHRIFTWIQLTGLLHKVAWEQYLVQLLGDQLQLWILPTSLSSKCIYTLNAINARNLLSLTQQTTRQVWLRFAAPPTRLNTI